MERKIDKILIQDIIIKPDNIIDSLNTGSIIKVKNISKCDSENTNEIYLLFKKDYLGAINHFDVQIMCRYSYELTIIEGLGKIEDTPSFLKMCFKEDYKFDQILKIWY